MGLPIAVFWVVAASRAAAVPDGWPSAYNVVWNDRGNWSDAGALGSVPLGSGRTGMNAWVDDKGIQLVLSATEAYDEYNLLMKIGAVTVTLDPNPFAPMSTLRGEKQYPAFSQTLDVERAVLAVTTDQIKVEAFVDWNHDLIRIRIQSVQEGHQFSARVQRRLIRNTTRVIPGLPNGGGELQPCGMCAGEFGVPVNITRHADTSVNTSGDVLMWYRRNPSRTLVDATLAQQLLQNVTAVRNNLRNNTFGAVITGEGLHKIDNGLLASSAPGSTLELQIVVHVNQTQSSKDWQSQVTAKAAAGGKPAFDDALRAHAAIWKERWQRSYMVIAGEQGTETYNHSMGYALGRYVDLCQGRGDTPTHFTGGIFTFLSHDSYNPYDLDWRAWGAAYWWQNTRFAYDPMLANGDYDTMLPLFDLYLRQLPLATQLVQDYYKHGGAKFYETSLTWGASHMDDWGCAKNNPPYIGKRMIDRPGNLRQVGCSRLNVSLSDCDTQNNYIRHHYSSAIEVPLMMLRHYLHTRDETIALKYLLPVATATMQFFNEHWSIGDYFLQDAQALESYSHCDLPSCQVAGLTHLLRGLLLPSVRSISTPSQQQLFEELQGKVNATSLPLFTSVNTTHAREKFNASSLPLMAPCGKGGDPMNGYEPGVWEQQNYEPVMLYAAWPYELLGVNRSLLPPFPAQAGIRTAEEAFAVGLRSYQHRPYPNDLGYNMDSVFAANLGQVDDAMRMLNIKWHVKQGPFDYSSARFPVWWGPSNEGGEACDYPGCNEIIDEARITLQHMLVQSDNHGSRLLLFPAWPRQWDVSFRIHCERATIIEGVLAGGKLKSLVVTPKSRERDVVVLLNQDTEYMHMRQSEHMEKTWV